MHLKQYNLLLLGKSEHNHELSADAVTYTLQSQGKETALLNRFLSKIKIFQHFTFRSSLWKNY